MKPPNVTVTSNVLYSKTLQKYHPSPNNRMLASDDDQLKKPPNDDGHQLFKSKIMTEEELERLNKKVIEFYGDEMFSETVAAAIIQFIQKRKVHLEMRNERKKKDDKESLFPSNRPAESILPSNLTLAFYEAVK